MGGVDWASVTYLAVLLLAISGGVVAAVRRSPGRTLQQWVLWGLIFVGLIAGYGLWPQVRQGLFPREGAMAGGGFELPTGPDGHYYVAARVNGAPVTFLIDTGASAIVLSTADARRVGIDPDNLAFTGRATTANGTVETAPVRLGSLKIGPWTDKDIAASVNRGQLDTSLLGMSYLRQFDMTTGGGRLVLRRR